MVINSAVSELLYTKCSMYTFLNYQGNLNLILYCQQDMKPLHSNSQFQSLASAPGGRTSSWISLVVSEWDIHYPDNVHFIWTGFSDSGHVEVIHELSVIPKMDYVSNL